MKDNYLLSIKKQFLYNRDLGWKTIAQVPSEKLNWTYNDESNGITQIVKHLSSNMLSRWTDFLTSDGEKEWRNRDEEFEGEELNFEQIKALWDKGWDCLINSIDQLKAGDLEKIVFIRNQGHTVVEAINRQLSHYSYHVGQIVFIGKMIRNNHWESLSIPKGQSSSYNKEMFSKDKKRAHFTKDFLDKDSN
ncbi:Protein of unknown function [Reichenbachiella faecimaris]|uniref:DUF1572 domain-containing protein n=1 Tax=Reichenbachiella faecimaris TaxID=692418 RepID=A0A1W2G7K5_REIFA|nr:DUF1572 family protein [Reichenbachiella faecimaris]SMD32669.1 Protein of unknown function [Reichenbachiella faecimaris]